MFTLTIHCLTIALPLPLPVHLNNNLHVYSKLGTIHYLASALSLPIAFCKLLFLKNMSLFSWAMAYLWSTLILQYQAGDD